MLGLPEGVSACLFDLDGVLTKTAAVHAAAWKQMFDEYLQAAAARDHATFVPFDARRGLRRLRRRQAPSRRGPVVPGLPPHRAGRRPARRLARGGDGQRSREPQERPGAGEDPDRRGRAVRGSVRYLQAAQRAGLRRAVVSSSANCRDVLAAAGIEGFIEVRIDGKVAAERKLAGKPAPDTYLAAAQDLGVGRPPPRCSRTPWPGWRPAGPERSAASSGSTGSVRPRPCAPRAPIWW